MTETLAEKTCTRKFRFRNFREALAFVHATAWIMS
jgi:pterin-4a-carbinolamine dehydratase